MRQALASVKDEEKVARQAQIVNELLASLTTVESDDHLAIPPRRLASVHRIDALRGETRPADPLIPLAQSDLLVNARGEPSVGQAIHREIASADRIGLLCAFIKWHGLRTLEEPLEAYLRSGRKLRVITTTYVGATERKAIDRLLAMGAELKVSYQTDHTRLHAKAWLFHRDSGFSTAFIGSSNLSKSALLDGVEWNVRLSQIDAPTILEKFAATFDSYWADPSSRPIAPKTRTGSTKESIRPAARRSPPCSCRSPSSRGRTNARSSTSSPSSATATTAGATSSSPRPAPARRAARQAMRIADALPSEDDRLLLGASRPLHLDDPERLAFLRALLSRDAISSAALSTRERRIVEGFVLTLTPEERDLDAVLRGLARSTAARTELVQLLDVLEDRAEHQTFPIAEAVRDAAFADVPLAPRRRRLHAKAGLPSDQSPRDVAVRAIRATIFYGAAPAERKLLPPGPSSTRLPDVAWFADALA